MREKVLDNALVLGIIGLAFLAVLFIGLNILIRDGPDVPSELNFLEGIVGGIVAALALLDAFKNVLDHKRRMKGQS